MWLTLLIHLIYNNYLVPLKNSKNKQQKTKKQNKNKISTLLPAFNNVDPFNNSCNACISIGSFSFILYN